MRFLRECFVFPAFFILEEVSFDFRVSMLIWFLNGAGRELLQCKHSCFDYLILGTKVFRSAKDSIEGGGAEISPTYLSHLYWTDTI